MRWHVVPSDMKILLGINKEKIYSSSTTNWLSGATGFNASTTPASKNRSELLADNIESTKLADLSHDLFGERVVVAKNTAPR